MINLDRVNYHAWKGKMKDLFYCKNYHTPILGDSAKPEYMKDNEWVLLNRQVCGYIRTWVDDNVRNLIRNKINAYVLWNKCW
ncbi:hypothetical protein Pint_31194 [Pistacia integerrima]|uniref:Uncharacterized protein n=1 Tax=Pistacia integerrima TaxID=434235 RepID=A0ACC0XRP9_9ROSI|nr:hypothetical protein Pint_31194 [Pistacia integerrima]